MAKEQHTAPPAKHATDEAVVADHYNPVNMTEMIGASFLGILTLILLFALLRAQKRNRTLMEQLVEQQ